jgi:long-chain acyl-CoA synthetase
VIRREPPSAAGARVWLERYPPKVPRTLDLPDQSLPDLLYDTVRQYPDRAAIIYYGKRWTYAQLWEATGRVAANLQRDGLRPGDRLALHVPNCPAYPIAFFGALRAGLTVVQASPLYIGQDLIQLLRDSQPQAIVTLDLLYANLAAVEREVQVPREYVAELREFYPIPKRWFVNRVLRSRGQRPGLPSGPRVRRFRTLLAPGTPSPSTIRPAEDVAVFQYTGGTTGVPKAALLTHRNLVANALQCRAWFTLVPPGTGTVLASIPFSHVYGMTVALNFPISEGATIVLQNRPDIPEILELIDRYPPTEFPGVPALYQAFNQHPDTPNHNLRSIRVCVSGSAPLPPAVQRRFEQLTGGFLLEGYGLTEASPVTHANPVEGERRIGSIGVPLPNTDQMIIDLETGTREVLVGELGELCVRGPQVMKGYYGRPEETSAVLRDGWLRTGDIARVDREGFAYIVDRKKDMIDVGGLKVYPREVEDILYQHSEVLEAAVVGVPDPNVGEVVKAFVVRKPGGTVTEAALIDFVRSQIAHYKAPRGIEFRPSLPRSSVQKVLRRQLRQEASLTPGALEPPGTPLAPVG